MALFATMLTANFTSCTEDACANVECNNGTCFDGDCVCDVGFVLDPVTGDCVSADPCELVTCGDNSFCLEGICECDAGFEKDADDNCIASTGKFLGTYDVREVVCDATYVMEVTEVADEVTVIALGNLGSYGCVDDFGNPINYSVYATIDGNTLSINNYETCSTVFNGTGTLDGNTLTVAYTATYDVDGVTQTDDCTADMTRR